MSRLYHTEKGHVVPTMGEELSRFRRARKVLDLPATSAPATLYLLARPWGPTAPPLQLRLNGKALPPLAPGPAGYTWYQLEVAPTALQAGSNTLELWAESAAMDAWALALEGGHAQPQSWASDDGGQSWRNQAMGCLNCERGEYVVRIRLAEGEDPPPPALVWEDPRHIRVQALRELIPVQAKQAASPLAQVQALSTWLASSWEHTSSGRAAQYTPWDAPTILSWGPSQRGHNGQRPIAMCVHYAVALVSCCQALGIPARCAAVTGALNSGDGHFIAEVWLAEFGKWVMVDPNTDAIAWKDGVPLSIPEIQREGAGLGALLRFGPGAVFQRGFPHMVAFADQNLKQGVCFAHRSVWWRADLLSRPEFSPSGHGATSYCETGLVWEKSDAAGLGMFPAFADPAYFDRAPA
ncbi:MAG: transglutaminase domain-containing protein [Candidatus Latescibacteria bacterium]|nr:transglutaminase domain-containing protein [Candidatus Latescibacterota bacterium]